MFKRIAATMLLIVGIVGWNASNANWTVGTDWCGWNGTDCATGGTLSSASFMIAHRMERHSMVTYDGAIHVIVNNGTNLQMYTSTNNGASWTAQALSYSGTSIFANTTQDSTTDVAILPPGDSGSQTSMAVVFNDYSKSAVEEAQLSWNGSSWTVNAFAQILSAAGATYTMPSYLAVNQASNTLEGEYLAVMVAKGNTTQIEIFYNNDEGAGYVNTGLSVPNPSNPNNCNEYSPPACPNTSGYANNIQHAPRLVFLPLTGSDCQSVGLLYEAYNDAGSEVMQLYWEVITASESGQNPTGWTLSAPVTPVSVGPMPQVQQAVDDSGFSVATVVNSNSDSPGTQYLAYLAAITSDSGPVTYIRTAVYNPSSGWGDYQAITSNTSPPTYPPSYVKLTYSVESSASRVFLFFDNYTSGTGALFVDAWRATTPFTSCTTTCYSHLYQLNTPTIESGQSYGNPRIDAPEYLTTADTVPMWLQYTYDDSPPELPYSLLFWSVYIIPPP